MPLVMYNTRTSANLLTLWPGYKYNITRPPLPIAVYQNLWQQHIVCHNKHILPLGVPFPTNPLPRSLGDANAFSFSYI